MSVAVAEGVCSEPLAKHELSIHYVTIREPQLPAPVRHTGLELAVVHVSVR